MAELMEEGRAPVEVGRLPGSTRACEACICLTLFGLAVSSLLAYVLLAMCFVAMNCLGWILTIGLQGCEHHPAMRTWLLALQMVFLLEGMLASLVQRCLQARPELAAAFHTSTRAKVFVASYDVVSSILKAAWCVHAQSLVAHSEAHKGCGDMLPWFMYWFSWSLLIHIFFIAPFTHIGVALAVWAARSGLLATSRGARPGTLEAMESVEYDPAVFADPDDPGDARPQRECCCCLDEYTAEEAIVKTPCQHYLHRACLGKWLQQSNVCPICRR